MDSKFIFAYLIFAIAIGYLAWVNFEYHCLRNPKEEQTNNLQLPMRTQMYTFGHSEEFKTMDGMPCVVFTNDKGAGLSCDWSYVNPLTGENK